METGGRCHLKGASGEGGCGQWLSDTWKYWSVRALGYNARMTETNERYVMLYKIQTHLNEGYSEAEVSLIWNQGHAGRCKAGTNRWGVRYNSCAYQQKVLALLR